MSRTIEIVEVGPRDGLQSEPGVMPTAAKIAFNLASVDTAGNTGTGATTTGYTFMPNPTGVAVVEAASAIA